MKDNPKILFFGAEAIGGTVGSWIAEKHDNIFLWIRARLPIP